MLDFIKEVGKFVGGLIGKIINIPITGTEHGITIGIVLIIIVILSLTIMILKGGKGD